VATSYGRPPRGSREKATAFAYESQTVRLRLTLVSEREHPKVANWLPELDPAT
jgi:hypothetical protein